MLTDHQNQAIAAFPSSASDTYSVILADPPWKYQRTAVQGGLDVQYETMTLDELKQIPVSRIASRDSLLFMWATSTHMEEALILMRAWGFEFKTIFRVWRKVYRSGKTVLGVGYWNRSCFEFLLVGVRKNSRYPFIKNRRGPARSQELCAVPIGHSRKPAQVYLDIEELGTPGKRIELFARMIREGWDSWGSEIPRFIYRDVQVPSPASSSNSVADENVDEN